MPSFGPAAPGCSLDKEETVLPAPLHASQTLCLSVICANHICRCRITSGMHWLAPPSARTRICANAGLTYDCARVLDHPVQKACRDIVSLS